MKTYTIYKINFPNNKSYIGMTSKRLLSSRKASHIYDSNHNSTLPVHNAIRKYGRDNITWEILESGILSLAEVNFLEKYYIKFYNSLINYGGYNILTGGTSENSFAGNTSALVKFHKENPDFRKNLKRNCLKDPIKLARQKNAGKQLVNFMKKTKINNIAVIIVKDCSIIEFESVMEAAKYIGIKPYIISKYFSGKLKHVRNYQIYRI